jgi:[protein-PII] uridylyltransferase
MVRLDNDASPASTLVEVVAEDRPGLLYELAMAISGYGCNIEVALLDTQAHQALDIFYVTRQGAKLDPAAAAALREALLAVCRRQN